MADITLTGRYGRLYGWLDWVVRLAVVNVLWIAGALAGALVAGIAPATVAAFWLLREYSLGRSPSMWRDFWRQWLAEFGRSQLRLGFPLLTVFVIAFYVLAARNADGSVTTGVALGLTMLLAAFVATLLYLPAVLAHFDLETVDSWQVTAAVAWHQPLLTIGLLFTTLAATVAMFLVQPAALLFFAVSLPAWLATKAAHRGLAHIDPLNANNTDT